VNVTAGGGAATGFGGIAVHATSAAQVTSAHAAEAAMEWIVLEALVALAAGLAIVWWTMSPARKRERENERRDAGSDASAKDQSEAE
jgi:hypothetical protein